VTGTTRASDDDFIRGIDALERMGETLATTITAGEVGRGERGRVGAWAIRRFHPPVTRQLTQARVLLSELQVQADAETDDGFDTQARIAIVDQASQFVTLASAAGEHDHAHAFLMVATRELGAVAEHRARQPVDDVGDRHGRTFDPVPPLLNRLKSLWAQDAQHDAERAATDLPTALRLHVATDPVRVTSRHMMHAVLSPPSPSIERGIG
jgi:hypothetical protein